MAGVLTASDGAMAAAITPHDNYSIVCYSENGQNEPDAANPP